MANHFTPILVMYPDISGASTNERVRGGGGRKKRGEEGRKRGGGGGGGGSNIEW